jgi:methylglutaconyl-CoA hydratase
MTIEETDDTSVLLEASPSGVATVTLNRPELHNAFNDTVVERLGDIFADLAAQDGIRIVLLRANGPSFSAGADLEWMRRAAEYDEERNLEDAQVLGRMLENLYRMPKPTVALVQGSAYGGGVGLVAACDVAIAVKGASFALTEVRLGLVPAVISPYVVGAIGARQARRYFLTAERIAAAEALRIGLVHAVVEDDAALDGAAGKLVAQVMAAAPGAVADAKELIATVLHQPIDDVLVEETARRIAERRASDEGREGIAAFLDKRKPRWVE